MTHRLRCVALVVPVVFACAPKPQAPAPADDRVCDRWASKFERDFLEEIAPQSDASTDFIRYMSNPDNYDRFHEELDDCCLFVAQARDVQADGRFTQCLAKDTGAVLRNGRFW